jgi:hypothetical protein
MRRWLLTPLVASLFLVSFAESWAALTDAADDAGIPYPKPWPWVIDGFIVAMALSIIEADRERGKVAVWPRVGLLVATALSTGIQAAWAPQEDWAWALHAWSPLAVLFSFECLVWLWRPAWEPVPTPSAHPQPATVPAPAGPPSGPEHPVETRPKAAQGAGRQAGPAALGRPFTPADHEQVQAWVNQGRTNKAEMARELGLHKRGQLDLGRYVNQLRDVPVQVGHRNGDGDGP